MLKSSRRLHPLTSTGIAHFVLPLLVVVVVGVIGAYMLVSGNAQTASAAKAKPSGYMLLYSEQGRYDKVIIDTSYASSVRLNDPVRSGQCGKDANQAYLYKLSKKKPLKLKCTASTYDVYFLKPTEKVEKLKDDAPFTSVRVATKYCTFIHANGITRNEALVNGRCVGDNNPAEDVITKVTPIVSLTITPTPVVQGKASSLAFEVKSPDGRPLSPEECAGTITASFTKEMGDTATISPLGLRYSSKTKSCLYKEKHPSDLKRKASRITAVTNFSGNKYLNPATSAPYVYDIAKNVPNDAKRRSLP